MISFAAIPNNILGDIILTLILDAAARKKAKS